MLSFIVFGWFLDISFMPREAYALNNYQASARNVVVTEIGVDATFWNRLTLAGSMESFEYPDGFSEGMPSFNIYSLNSKFSANFRVTPDNSKATVNLYAQHECRHPVTPWREKPNTFNYASTRFGVKISGKF